MPSAFPMLQRCFEMQWRGLTNGERAAAKNGVSVRTGGGQRETFLWSSAGYPVHLISIKWEEHPE